MSSPSDSHPSHIIEEELSARGWSRRELAERMGCDVDVNLLSIDMYCECKSPDVRLGEETSEMLAKAFGTSSAFWMRLDEQWRTKMAQKP